MVAFDVCPALLIIFEELSKNNHDVAEPVNVGNRQCRVDYGRRLFPTSCGKHPPKFTYLLDLSIRFGGIAVRTFLVFHAFKA